VEDTAWRVGGHRRGQPPAEQQGGVWPRVACLGPPGCCAVSQHTHTACNAPCHAFTRPSAAPSAAQALVATARGLEAKHDAEKGALEARGRAERARHASEARTLEIAAAAARERAGRLQQLFEAAAAEARAAWQGAAAPDSQLDASGLCPAGGDGGPGPAAAPPPAPAGAPPDALPLAAQAAPARWLYRHRPGAWRAADAALRDLALEANPAALGEHPVHVLGCLAVGSP
jgi:hypothetical protein